MGSTLKFKRSIVVFAIVALLFPFLLILLISIILEGIIKISSFLPSLKNILIIIDYKKITFSNFVYYYLVIISTEVGSVFSYFLYKLSIKKDNREVYESTREEKKDIYIMLSEVLSEIEYNKIEYTRLRGDPSHAWSFKQAFEIEGKFNFIYGDEGNSFKMIAWLKYKNVFQTRINKIDFMYSDVNLIELYNRITVILDRKIIYDISDLGCFYGLAECFEKCTKEIRKLQLKLL